MLSKIEGGRKRGRHGPCGLQSVFLGCLLRGLCPEKVAFLTASWVVCPPRLHLWGRAFLRAGLVSTREPTAMRFSAWGLAHVPPPHGSELPCLSACLCSLQAAALSPFSRTAGRVLRGTGGGKRNGRHLSCSQLGWKCTVSSVLIRRCLNHPQGQLSICEDQTMTCVGSTVSVVVWMSFSSLPQIHVPLCPSFLTWTLSSFPPDTSGF